VTEHLSKRLHQLAAAGLLLAAAGAVIAAAVLPLAGHVRGLQAEIEQSRDLLGRFWAFAANKDKVARLARQSDDAMRAGIFLGGDTDAVRAAGLQALLTKVAEAHGVRLRSARTLAATERDGLRFIGVQAELDATTKQLQHIVMAFESMRPYLFIQSLQIAPHDMHGNGGDELKARIGIAGAVAANGKG